MTAVDVAAVFLRPTVQSALHALNTLHIDARRTFAPDNLERVEDATYELMTKSELEQVRIVH